MDQPVCAVLGVGPGNGAAIARAFAGAGHAVALLARRVSLIDELASELSGSMALACDIGQPAEVARALDHVAATLGPVDTLVYNGGRGAFGAIDAVSVDDFEQTWRMHTLGLFASAKSVIPAMKQRGRGSIVVIGATASRRGVAGTAAFAPAKMAQKGLAESMARHLGPAGIHVSLLILDGLVLSPEARARYPDRAADRFISPDAVAAAALALTPHPPTAWTFEMDLRPAGESW
jgi:NAD(P)-dependent dehydrogenase (short-subunit alcohol dehydrogenase family)